MRSFVRGGTTDAVKLDSPEFAASPVAQANAASWDEALTKPETHDAGGERLDESDPEPEELEAMGIDPDATQPRQ